MKLAIVTLAFNNLAQAQRTLASVALQTEGPNRSLIIDGSSEPIRNRIRALAAKADAEYFWQEPRGVYPAMNDALRRLDSDSFVWFINSSDWLASPHSVSIVRENFRESDSWLVGGLERYGDSRTPFHPMPKTGDQFVQYLTTGRIGFPHPSAIVSVKAILSSGAFDLGYRIAADYALALRLASHFPIPHVLPHILAVHDPTGLTSRNRVRHYFEKSHARRKLGASRMVEAARLLRALSSVSGYGTSSSLAGEEKKMGSRPNQDTTFTGWGMDGLRTLDSW